MFITQDPARDGGNWWAYCNSNPIKYVDTDGKKLTLTVDKSTQKMNVKLTIPFYRHEINFDVNVTTHVVADSDTTQTNKNANENLAKRNPNGSAWTQFPNGEWNITGFKTGPNENVDGTVDEQLTTDAHQELPVRNNNGAVKSDEEGNIETVKDTGYNVHFTENSNTAGCIGVKNKLMMKSIITLFKFNEKFDPKTSKIIVKDEKE